MGGIGFLQDAHPPIASACSCVDSTTAEQAERAGLIAKGGGDLGLARGGPAGTRGQNVLTLRLTDMWRGGYPTGPVTVRSPADGASCGVEGVEQGQAIVVFADRGETLSSSASTWQTTTCSGTGPATQARIDAVTSVLGNPTAVRADPQPVEDSPGPGRMVAALVAVAVAALGAGAAEWLRWRPRA